MDPQAEQLLPYIFFYGHVVTGDKESRQRHSTNIKFFWFFHGYLWLSDSELFVSKYIEKIKTQEQDVSG